MTEPASPPLCQPGELLAGQFRIVRKLGQGGMGEVFLAEQAEIERQVAVKVVHRYLLDQYGDLRERLRREALVVARVNHPHIVGGHLFGQTEDGRPYLVMEYVDGRSLTTEIRGPQLSEPRALHIAGQVCQALVEAHDAGIVHRDLKPDNIVLTSRHGDDDYVKVLDFGIAKLMDRQDSKLTRTGSFFGTP